jgi:dipeptidyl aminopeptidase/acylaminoacyl peptidase
VVPEPRPLTLEDFWSLRTVSDVQLSPDGTTLAYVVGTYDQASNQQRSAIWLADVGSGQARQFTGGAAADTTPRWSPDGTRIAFVSTRQEDKPQVFVIPTAGGEPRRVTAHPDGATVPVWSPDSTRLCVSVALETDRQQVAQETQWLEAHADLKAKAPRLRRQASVLSRFDARGYMDRRVHLFVVATGEGETAPRQITDGDWDDLIVGWSPDGSAILFVSNRTEQAEHNLVGDLWLVSPEGGAPTRLTDGSLSVPPAGAAFSPDGETIAFYAHPELVAHGVRDAHMWTVSRHGGAVRDLSAALDQTCGGGVQPDYQDPASASLAWSPDGGTVYAIAMEDADAAVFAFDAATGTARRLSSPGATVAGLQVMPDGRSLVLLASTPTRPYDLFTLPTAGGRISPLTDTNGALLRELGLVDPEHIRFNAADGQEIEGWLYPPLGAGTRQGERYPLILNIHGGPFGAWGSCFYLQAQAMAGAGYASLYLNPRGSYGHGFAFASAADWGLKDFQDLMDGVDAVLARGEVDPARLGVTGISYGGYMTNWTVGHTTRFAGAVSVNGVSNLVSMYGVSDIIPLWFESEFGGPFWTSDAQWDRYRRHSPISYVGAIETPLLLLQSENDYRCPIDQGEQLLTALRMRRRVVELIRFPGASHFIATTAAPHHRYLQWKLARDWFDTHVQRAGRAPTVEEEAEEGCSRRERHSHVVARRPGWARTSSRIVHAHPHGLRTQTGATLGLPRRVVHSIVYCVGTVH